MSAAWIAAAALAVLLAFAHSLLGERYLLVRLLRREDLPRLFGGTEFTKRTLRFAWHLTSVAWLGFAALLVLLASGPAGETRAQVALVVAATFALGGVVALVGSRGRHPAWIGFFAIAVLTWLGSR
jgi:hypothetical protein